ncbi:MAG: hypothetical protein STSR0001_08310 [Methanothrix sp.]
MNETTTENSILLLIALIAAILSAPTSSAEIKGPTDGIHEGTADFDLSESINSTANSIALAENNGSTIHNGTGSMNGGADGEFNGTVYRLGELVTEVTVPVNASRLNLTLPEKVDNITLYDEAGRMVKINSSHSFWQGNFIYSLNFERHVEGRLVYNLTSQGQQFVISIRDKGPVRVILPEGYTTGDRLLGIAWPPPDMIASAEKKSALTWYNTTMVSYIEVNYYRDNALEALMIIISILALAAIALLVEYYFSIRKLRSLRMEKEEESMKKN